MKKRSSSNLLLLPSQSSDLLQQQQNHSSPRPRKQARVTIMHVCPPVIVRVQPFEFRLAVQQLTGCHRSADAQFHTTCDAPHHHHHHHHQHQQERQHSQQKQEENENEFQDLVVGEAKAEAVHGQEKKDLLNHSNHSPNPLPPPPPPPITTSTTTSSASTTTTSSSSSSIAAFHDQEDEEVIYDRHYLPPSHQENEEEEEEEEEDEEDLGHHSSIILPLHHYHQFSPPSHSSSSYDYTPDHNPSPSPLPFDQMPPFSDLLHDHVSPLDCYQPSLDHIRFDELSTPKSMHSFQDLDFSIMETYAGAFDQHQSELIVS